MNIKLKFDIYFSVGEESWVCVSCLMLVPTRPKKTFKNVARFCEKNVKSEFHTDAQSLKASILTLVVAAESNTHSRGPRTFINHGDLQSNNKMLSSFWPESRTKEDKNLVGWNVSHISLVKLDRQVSPWGEQ